MTTALESQIDEWRRYIERRQAVDAADIAEMEDHLRGQIDDLIESGLDSDEAFLVAVKRMGSVDEISREFAREHSDRLWKQLVLSPDAAGRPLGIGRDLGIALAMALGAAATVRVAMSVIDNEVTLISNVALFVLPWATAYFAVKRRLTGWAIGGALAAFVIAALVVNLYPFARTEWGDPGTTGVLAILHVPIVLWFAVGLAYVGGQWASAQRRMDFIRFTGEWVVYMALLALGGGVLTGLTIGTYSMLGFHHEDTLASWIVPTGAAGATVIAAWLVEAKQAVVENIAPVLTRVFTPLTVLMLVGVLVAFAVRHNFTEVNRDLLTLMDLVLVLVLGLVLYAISARDPLEPAGWFERLQVVLLVVALAVDAVLLAAMLTRIIDAGFTANKVAALGLNLVLLVNLIWSTRLSLSFVRGRTPFSALEHWQTSYLPVYGLWAAFVVVALPPIFGFA